MALIVVTGPPAGGKSTWVREHARPGDIIVDYDLLAGALTAPSADAHDHTRTVRDVAFRARSAAIREALKHLDQVDVYLIHSLPSADVAAKYAEHGARIVTVDPGRDVVMARIMRERPASARAVAERWYATQSDTQAVTQRSSRNW